MENNMLRKKTVRILFFLIVLVGVIFWSYYYLRSNKLQPNSQINIQQETADLVAKVSKLMVLPSGETPTIATVSNPALLKDQPFFASALKGDKVLIYNKAQKVILYSVGLNKILNITPLNIGTQTTITPLTTPKQETSTSTKKK